MLTSKMEAMEQQMLATHMRVCSAQEEAEATARSMVDPLRDELISLCTRIVAVETEVQMLQQSKRVDAAAAAAEAEQRLSSSQNTQASTTETAVLVARLEAAVMVVTRGMDESERRISNMQQDQTSQWLTLRERIESAEVARGEGMAHVESKLEASLREDQCRHAAEVAAVRTRIESLEQTIVATDARVSALSGKGSSCDDPDSRIATIENSFQELESRLLKQQELPAIQARLDMAEKQLQDLQPNIAQAMAKLLQQDMSDVINRIQAAEAKVQHVEAGLENVNRLGVDLADDRKERFRTLAEINHISEVVVNAAAATIERAEQKSAEKSSPEHEHIDTILESSKLEDSSTSSRSLPDQIETLVREDSTKVSSDLARCVGEMDAELRMELNNTMSSAIGAVYKDLDNLRNSTMMRFTTIEDRLTVLEKSGGDNGLVKELAAAAVRHKSSSNELKDVAKELGARAERYASMLDTAPRIPSLSRIHDVPDAAKGKMKSVESCDTGPTSTWDTTSTASSGKQTDVQERASSLENSQPLSEMFKQAMRGTPGVQPQITDDLKSHLLSLVTAVNRTLGEEAAAITSDLESSSRQCSVAAPTRNVSSPRLVRRDRDQSGEVPYSGRLHREASAAWRNQPRAQSRGCSPSIAQRASSPPVNAGVSVSTAAAPPPIQSSASSRRVTRAPSEPRQPDVEDPVSMTWPGFQKLQAQGVPTVAARYSPVPAPVGDARQPAYFGSPKPSSTPRVSSQPFRESRKGGWDLPPQQIPPFHGSTQRLPQGSNTPSQQTVRRGTWKR